MFPHLTGFDPLAARRLRAARMARDSKTLRRALNIMRAVDPHSRGGAGDRAPNDDSRSG